MKKAKLNEEMMRSELSESQFFRPKRQEGTEQATEPAVTPPLRADDRPYRHAPRRIIARNAFEIYQDQLESLRDFSLDEKTQGAKGSMSEMVREALDTYISERTKNGRP